jgi:hypothetical protein
LFYSFLEDNGLDDSLFIIQAKFLPRKNKNPRAAGSFRISCLERATGFAPVPKPWKGFVLLLHYARIGPP